MPSLHIEGKSVPPGASLCTQRVHWIPMAISAYRGDLGSKTGSLRGFPGSVQSRHNASHTYSISMPIKAYSGPVRKVKTKEIGSQLSGPKCRIWSHVDKWLPWTHPPWAEGHSPLTQAPQVSA